MLFHVFFATESPVAPLLWTIDGAWIYVLCFDMSNQSSFVFEWARPFAVYPTALKRGIERAFGDNHG
jgi:hypothetical protein